VAHLLTHIPTNAQQHASSGCSDFKHTSAARSRIHDRSSRVCPGPPAEHVWGQQRVRARRRHRPPACNLARWRFRAIPQGPRAVWTAVASACAHLAHGPCRHIDCSHGTVLAPTCSPQTKDNLFPLLPSSRRRRGPESMPPVAFLLALCCRCLLVPGMERGCSNYAGHLAPFAFACAPSIASKPFPRPTTAPLLAIHEQVLDALASLILLIPSRAPPR
jgi:hypothetical protein